MKKIISLLVFSSFTVTAFAASVYGKWGISVQDREIRYDLLADVKETNTTFTVACTIGTDTASVTVEIPTKIENGKIHVLGTGSKEEKIGPIDCKVSISPVVYSLEASENLLKVTTDKGQIVFLKRLLN
ncbi:MAG: hypothetical protein A4S09_11035 [Proteobacteria bacterium SG_bin7]|nr:MAG: hypothetical protein A4S09_11035 [Proteobacteria bacterium SG_bin7]